MDMQIGIKETKEAFAFLLSLFIAVRDSAADDGRITLRDSPRFLPLVWSAPTAFGGITDVPREFSDLDEQEKQELRDIATQNFDIPNDDLEFLIEKTWATMIDFVDLGSEWVQYARSRKNPA